MIHFGALAWAGWSRAGMLASASAWVAERMLNGLVEGSLLALFAWMMLRLAGRQQSRTRFAVWFGALAGVAALPLMAPENQAKTMATSTSSAAVALPSSWAVAMIAVWGLVAIVALARIGIGLWHLLVLRRDAVQIDPAKLDDGLREPLLKFGAGRAVAICVSRSLRVPTAVGFFKPVVIFPEWALKELPANEQYAVLLHELAHLRRWDDWTNLAQKILKAIFFFHPAIWWIEGRLTLEREMACDDFVLEQTENPRAYAECLVSLAEKSFLRRGLAMAQAIVGQVRQTALRVAGILDANRSSATRRWKPTLAIVATAAMMAVVTVSKMPQLVAFQDGRTSPGRIARETSARGSSHGEVVVAAAKKVVQPKPFMASPTVRAHAKTVSYASTVSAKFEEVAPGVAAVVPVVERAESGTVNVQPVWLVMQTQQSGPQGVVFWSIEIYQLAVLHPVQPVEVHAKQI